MPFPSTTVLCTSVSNTSKKQSLQTCWPVFGRLTSARAVWHNEHGVGGIMGGDNRVGMVRYYQIERFRSDSLNWVAKTGKKMRNRHVESCKPTFASEISDVTPLNCTSHSLPYPHSSLDQTGKKNRTGGSASCYSDQKVVQDYQGHHHAAARAARSGCSFTYQFKRIHLCLFLFKRPH